MTLQSGSGIKKRMHIFLAALISVTSVAQRPIGVTVYPPLVLNYLFYLLDPLNIKSQNQTKNIAMGSRIPQSKFEKNRSKGSSVMIGQTNNQTNRDYNFLYIIARYSVLNSPNQKFNTCPLSDAKLTWKKMLILLFIKRRVGYEMRSSINHGRYIYLFLIKRRNLMKLERGR